MVFDHDTEISLRAAVELVNSAEPPDTLVSTEQLRRFVAEYRYTGAVAGDDAELAAVRAARAPLRRLLMAGRDEAARLVNDVLASHRAVPRLVRHDGFDYHVHAVGAGTPLADRITVETAMAMIDLIRADELTRLASCADPGCDGIVLDLSRNRSRRFCSTACGNRAAVAAYRARRR